MERNNVKLFTSVIVFAVFLISYAINPYFMNINTHDDAILASKNEKNSLIQVIKDRAKEFEEVPENAYIDEVWKKTPGLNGLKVNIEKSHENMKEEGKFNQAKLIFDEVPPAVSLSDLPASPIYRGHPKKDMVALLINVSWGAEYIPNMLQTLNKHQVKATFFIEGKWAKENKNIVEMIDEQNHLIGNHAYNHPNMAGMSEVEIRKQIDDTNDIIEAIIGEKPNWFAPPSGSFNESVVKIAHELEMETILWTVDTIDWKNPSVSVMINRVMNSIHPGAMILMHPTEPTSQGLDQLIEDIKSQNYKLHTIEYLLHEER